MNLPFRAMVSDLGGTLLTPEHLVGDLTIDTLRVFRAKRRRYYFGNRTQSYRYVIHSWKNRCGTCGYDYIKRCSCTGFTG